MPRKGASEERNITALRQMEAGAKWRRYAERRREPGNVLCPAESNRRVEPEQAAGTAPVAG
jgi:hypothetical protein